MRIQLSPGLIACLWSMLSSSLDAHPSIGPRAAPILVDDFSNVDHNSLGHWHGGDPGLDYQNGPGRLVIFPSNPDYSYYTRLSDSCVDARVFDSRYLHLAYEGSSAFSIALQQHNYNCNPNVAPFPETWDEVEASRYASANDIYVPMWHFNIEKSRTIGFALRGFFTPETTVIRKVEIVDGVPFDFPHVEKLPSGKLLFACTRPNSFAFGIDDGEPQLAQELMQIIKDEDILVTFFTVGSGLLEPSTNASNVYPEMKALGHQIGLHSFSHPNMESLPSEAEINSEYEGNLDAYRQVFQTNSKYFRPPYGAVGARMRNRLAAIIENPMIVNWDIDVEDWLWGESDTPEKQLEVFQRYLEMGGNLVVSHYLFPSTVQYFREFIRMAKATGKQIMRVDQCMEDPNAPALW